MAAEETADINLSIVREYKPPLSSRLGTGGTRLRGLDPGGQEVTDDVIITEAEPRLLLHHP